jgi:RecB family exonuclease
VAMTRAKERLYISSVYKRGKPTSVFIDDLLSNPAVTARDIERIEVPGIEEEEAAYTRSTRSAFSEPLARPDSQASLFSDVVPAPSAVYPDLGALLGAPPMLSPDGKLQLSATAIEDYRSCPLKYKLGHLLGIPTGPQPTLTFGNIMHQAVRHYFELRKKGRVTYEQIEKFYLNAWRDVGFEDAYQEQAYRKAGLEQLREFVAQHENSPVPPDKVRAEEFFSLDLGEVVLKGRIDQINPMMTAGKTDDSAVELVDYKTGRPKTQKDADKSLQLSVYALAARDQLKLRPMRLTFYNLTNNQPVSTVRTASDLKEAVAEIREVADEIRTSLFQPAPGFACKWCDYVPVCPAHEESY